MNIRQTLESLSIETSDGILFSELQAMMKKNFTKTLGKKDKIISFYDENEIIQRKYFFKFITKIYNQTHKDELNIKFAEYITIKLLYKQENSLKITIFADIEFVDNEARFRFDRSNALFISYIAQKFKKSQIFINDDQNYLIIKIANANETSGFDELFDKSEHMRFCTYFRYDKDKFIKFKREANIQNSQKFVRRFSALADLFSEHFKTLECGQNSDFESVRSRYLELVKIYHPDRHTQKSEKIKKEYREKFEKIQNAYESLKPYFKEQEIFVSA
ncbi:adenylosuccinate lyase [Campylobacter sp. RM16190]|uniref:adenylosuccinate lyase n=1 Tax=Campylobacter sp. RM16190 TaxID=1705727 RepID=UPI001473FE35|nr:adenylosuccinate lyase [Campylobacter sp. RM16190]